MIPLYELGRLVFGLRRNQWKSDEERERIRDKRLRKILHLAYRNTRFYRDVFDEIGLKPDSIKSKDGIEKLPIVTKEIIKDSPSSFISSKFEKRDLKKYLTSGTTGIPLTVYKDVKSSLYGRALLEFAFMEAGKSPFEKIVEIGNYSKKKYFLNKFGLFREYSIPINYDGKKHLEILKSLKAENIFTHPSIMEVLATHALDVDYEVKFKRFFSHGETLFEESVKLIDESFGCETFDSYGSTEFWRVGFECDAHEGLHIIDDSFIVEFCNDGDVVVNGDRGDIIVTGLYNNAMPLIRYDIGDIGIFSEDACSCGRKLPLIKSIEGRQDDFIILPDGKMISPRIPVYVINEKISDLRQFKIIQHKEDKIEFLYVAGSEFNENLEQTLKDLFKDLFGPGIELKFSEKKNILKEKSGKLRKVVSKVKR
jgi:phenylacetate-CoA ligase